MDFKKIIKKINNNEKIKGIYYYGNSGVGKTYQMQELVKATKQIHYFGKEKQFEHHVSLGYLINFPEYVEWRKSQIEKNKRSDGNEFTNMKFPSINDIKQKPILVIDDIGGENPSSWILRDMLFPILNYRIDKKLTTFFTSNFNINKLENYYRKKCPNDTDAIGRVIDRIYGLSIACKLEGYNHRRNNNLGFLQ